MSQYSGSSRLAAAYEKKGERSASKADRKIRTDTENIAEVCLQSYCRIVNHRAAQARWPSVGENGTSRVQASSSLVLGLDLTASVPESGRTNGNGSYIISLKGSTQQGLTGFMGFFRRRTVVSKTLSAQENNLIIIKKELEKR